MDEYISKKRVEDLLRTMPNPCDLLQLYTIARAIHFIENEPAADVQPIYPLVKVEERVPTVSGNYLCYLSNGEFDVLYFDRGIEDDEYNNDYPFGVWNTYPSKDGGEYREWIEVLEVTHWQPLPEPPKDDDEQEVTSDASDDSV